MQRRSRSRITNNPRKLWSIFQTGTCTTFPDLWPDPWKFDPDRFPPENRASLNNMAYMPFGIGRRTCIGARFAQLEAKLALFRLVQKFKFQMCEKTDDPFTLTCPNFHYQFYKRNLYESCTKRR
ncbi:putative cytochrome P450 6a14 like protein [Argiope bruennichi]|uniref:Putative cytochrome P450 6a14 like protein n=1 Tax=Argiope bruennichi TaxID=94029 RepID=A0A8T0ESV8_ARGBR|nr:putative cytochrome P450 6a14 like protein [Argiope bruennichi]